MQVRYESLAGYRAFLNGFLDRDEWPELVEAALVDESVSAAWRRTMRLELLGEQTERTIDVP